MITSDNSNNDSAHCLSLDIWFRSQWEQLAGLLHAARTKRLAMEAQRGSSVTGIQGCGLVTLLVWNQEASKGAKMIGSGDD